VSRKGLGSIPGARYGSRTHDFLFRKLLVVALVCPHILPCRADGHEEMLGLWIEQTEGAKFGLKVFNEL